jgi:hypothetical protein
VRGILKQILEIDPEFRHEQWSAAFDSH